MSDKNKSPFAAFIEKFNFRGAIVPLIFLVVGLLFIVYPESSMSFICYVLGALMLAAGLARLVLSFNLPSSSRFAEVIFACVIIAVGVLLIVAQSAVADFVTVVLGIILIIDAVLKIEENIVLRKLNPARWWVGLAVAVCCLIFGVVVVVLSFADSASKLLMIVAGISMLFDALCSFAILVYSAVKEVKEERGTVVKINNHAEIAAGEPDDSDEYDDDDEEYDEYDDDDSDGTDTPKKGGNNIIDI